MVEVGIFQRHEAIVFEESDSVWVIECTCGWREKGYGANDCEQKANDHTRKAPEFILTLPSSMQGRRRWRS